MFQDKVSDYRKQFSLWWQGEWKSVPFPEKGQVYDYYVHTDDEGNVSMAPWEDIVDPFTYSPEESFGNMFVNTVETTRMKYFLRSFVANRHYCMFVGNTGALLPRCAQSDLYPLIVCNKPLQSTPFGLPVSGCISFVSSLEVQAASFDACPSLTPDWSI